MVPPSQTTEFEDDSQFALLKSGRFLPFFLTQFFGALNDNLFKNALLVILVSAGLASSGQAGGQTNLLVNMAAGLFILPFFLFSALAGQLADKYEKSAIIRRIKLAEILIMLGGFAALWFNEVWAMMLVLFAMGTQSAFFGPVKYAIIPQQLSTSELVGGNAQIEMGTFVAILIGTIAGSLLAGLEHPALVVGLAVLTVALAGWLCSRRVPVAAANAPGLVLDFNPLREGRELFRLASEKRPVFLAILGISWFWLIGASYLTQAPNFAVAYLGGSPGLVALLLCGFTVGIATGSLLCERMSGHKVEIGLVPFGAIGLSLFGIELYFAANSYQADGLVGVWHYFSRPGAIRILLDLVLIGMFGGFYIVPLYAMVQMRTDEQKRARVIAFNNILNAFFMVISALVGGFLLGIVDIDIPTFYLLVSLLNIAVAVFIFQQVPEFTMRFLIWLLSHSMYRVSHSGLNNIPDKGAALLACNHVSYVDALIIAGAVRRPIRFIMYKPIFDLPVLNFIFRTGRAIPICSPKEDKEVYDAAMDAIAAGLAKGDLLCIFPEGKLTLDGELDEFRPGIERIIERVPAPVIPMALRGLWGGFFSHSGPGVFKTPFHRVWTRIALIAASPVQPPDLSAGGLREHILALRGERR
jgi:1-acyl-sn-glycerol-3-phosphate acyltransferase